MRKSILVFVLAAVALVAEEPKQPTVVELKVQLADSQQKVAELEQQILELNIRVALAEKAAFPTVDQARQQAQQKLDQAKEAAVMAHAAADVEKQQAKK